MMKLELCSLLAWVVIVTNNRSTYTATNAGMMGCCDDLMCVVRGPRVYFFIVVVGKFSHARTHQEKGLKILVLGSPPNIDVSHT